MLGQTLGIEDDKAGTDKLNKISQPVEKNDLCRNSIR